MAFVSVHRQCAVQNACFLTYGMRKDKATDYNLGTLDKGAACVMT